jgi:hypothetical protein
LKCNEAEAKSLLELYRSITKVYLRSRPGKANAGPFAMCARAAPLRARTRGHREGSLLTPLENPPAPPAGPWPRRALSARSRRGPVRAGSVSSPSFSACEVVHGQRPVSLLVYRDGGSAHTPPSPPSAVLAVRSSLGRCRRANSNRANASACPRVVSPSATAGRRRRPGKSSK